MALAPKRASAAPTSPQNTALAGSRELVETRGRDGRLSPMITPWMIFLDIMPVLAMVVAIVCVPLLSDGPPRHPDHVEK